MISINKILGLRTPLGLLKENIGAVKLTDDFSSFTQSKDIFNYRLLKFMDLKGKNKSRHIKVAVGIGISILNTLYIW